MDNSHVKMFVRRYRLLNLFPVKSKEQVRRSFAQEISRVIASDDYPSRGASQLLVVPLLV